MGGQWGLQEELPCPLPYRVVSHAAGAARLLHPGRETVSQLGRGKLYMSYPL